MQENQPPESPSDPSSAQRPEGRQEDPLEDLHPPPPELFRVASIFYLVLASVALIWIGWREGGITTALLWDVNLTPAAIPRALAIEVAIGLGSAALIVGAWELAERQFAAASMVGDQLRSMLSGLGPAEALSLALLSGLSEELFFRGAVQGSWGGWAGWAGATALFAVLHSGPGKHFRWWTLFAALAGGLMGLWFLLRGTLVAPIVAHVAVNGFQLLRGARRRQSS